MHFRKCKFYEDAKRQYGPVRGVGACLNE
jgi:hypothetical protein